MGHPATGAGIEPKNFARNAAVAFRRRLLRSIAPLSFVISTGMQRSGEVCGLAVPSWKCFRQSGASRLDGMIRLFFEGRR
jgi:hypothetical protein